MKKSVLIFLCWMGVLFLVMLSVFIYGRITLDRFVTDVPEMSSMDFEDWSNFTVDLDDVDQLEFHGAWTVFVTQGDDEQAVIRSPGEEHWSLTQSGSSRRATFRQAEDELYSFEIHVTVQDLTSVRNEGIIELTLNDLEMSEFKFVNDGMAYVTGNSSSIENLHIEDNGASEIDLFETPTRNAYISMDGAGNLQLNMTGGTLDGSLNGMGNISYRGNVSRENIQIHGLGVVEQVRN